MLVTYWDVSKCVVVTGFSSSGEEEYPKGEVVAKNHLYS